MSTSKRSLGEIVELSRDCELGQEGDRAVVVALNGHYMTLTFLDRAPDCRDVHTGADYKYLRAYDGKLPPDLAKLSIRARAKISTKTGLDRTAALRELRDLVATYLEGSDDAPRAATLLEALALDPLPSLLSDTFWDRLRTAIKEMPPTPTAEQEEHERSMFGCTTAAIDEVLVRKEPRDIAMYAMGTLSNAQTLIQRDKFSPTSTWMIADADANTIRQLINVAKYAIDKAVPREAQLASEARRHLHAHVQAMAQKFRDEVAQADAHDDKSPFDENNIEAAFVLLEQLTKAVPR